MNKKTGEKIEGNKSKIICVKNNRKIQKEAVKERRERERERERMLLIPRMSNVNNGLIKILSADWLIDMNPICEDQSEAWTLFLPS